MCDDFEDDFGEDFDDGFETMEDNTINNDSESENDFPKDDFTIEDAMFWGGYLGMMVDEEREDRRLAKKIEKENLEPKGILDSDKKDEDY